jgi:FkbM family methyltransferase
MDFKYIQVGAHVGNTLNDFIFNKITNNDNIILIEPVPYLFYELQNNYNQKLNDNKIIFINAAVSNYIGDIDLYVPSLKNDFKKIGFQASQLGSINKNHHDHIYHFPDLIIDKINIPCITLNYLIKKYKIKNIENLIVDTEGHDYEILIDLDLSVLKPKNITFECIHMDGTFKRGIRYNNLINHFKDHGYIILSENDYDTTISLVS